MVAMFCVPGFRPGSGAIVPRLGELPLRETSLPDSLQVLRLAERRLVAAGRALVRRLVLAQELRFAQARPVTDLPRVAVDVLQATAVASTHAREQLIQRR